MNLHFSFSRSGVPIGTDETPTERLLNRPQAITLILNLHNFGSTFDLLIEGDSDFLNPSKSYNSVCNGNRLDRYMG